MTPDDIKKAKILIDAATPGPWIESHDGLSSTVKLGTGPTICEMEYSLKRLNRYDANFIAAARTGWLEALDEIERLRTFINPKLLDDNLESKWILSNELDKLRAIANVAIKEMRYHGEHAVMNCELCTALKALEQK